MRSPFLEYFASALPARGLTVVRFNFPYMERPGRRPPDRMQVLADCYQDVVVAAARRTGCPPGPLFLGGKSMGARVAAHVAGRGGVEPTGLVFLGFALHSEDDRENLRTADLPLVHSPMLFVQGSRDPLCDLRLLTRVRREMNLPGAVHIVDGGDHSFQLAAAQKAQQQAVMERVADVVAIFVKRVLAPRAAGGPAGAGS
jgi:predicted alpha/beta-hydrolase family hydrolase